MKIALMGASGFIGSRMVEMYALGGLGKLYPIVRSFGSLARLARFDLDWRLADAVDEKALTKAFDGCDVVVHSVLGKLDTIEASIPPTYRAANRAGVRRLVYLSTASVHGQAPPPGTNEESPLSDRQPTTYNNLKVRAEHRLLKERQSGSTEVVILRPGIVFGPRDRWVTGIATDLLRRQSFLVNHGLGICNTIYVDNLIHAIKLALCAPRADREAFILGDQETITWADLTYKIADSLGISRDEISHVHSPVFHKTIMDRLEHIRGHQATQTLLPYAPKRLKRIAKACLTAWPQPAITSPWAQPAKAPQTASRETSELHQCPTKLSHTKASRLLNFHPVVSFETGLDRTIASLENLGTIKIRDRQ